MQTPFTEWFTNHAHPNFSFNNEFIQILVFGIFKYTYTRSYLLLTSVQLPNFSQVKIILKFKKYTQLQVRPQDNIPPPEQNKNYF